MNILKFDCNYNDKLDATIFTTIRKASYEKEYFYYSQIDQIFKIQVNNKFYRTAKLICVEDFIFNEIPIGLLCLDTGLLPAEACGVFAKLGIIANTKVLILTFQI